MIIINASQRLLASAFNTQTPNVREALKYLKSLGFDVQSTGAREQSSAERIRIVFGLLEIDDIEKLVAKVSKRIGVVSEVYKASGILQYTWNLDDKRSVYLNKSTFMNKQASYSVGIVDNNNYHMKIKS